MLSTTPQTQPSPHLDTFLVYLGANTNLRPRHTLVARAAATATLPTLSYSLPSGTVVAFPEFLAFLTLEKSSPGAGVIFNYVVDQSRTLFTLHRWAAHPASILTDVAKILSATKFSQEQKLAAALTNRNSFFIPFDRLTGVSVGRRSAREGHQVYLTLTTLDGPFMICEDAATEGWFTSMGSMLGLKPWQPELITLLQGAASKAQAPSAAPAPPAGPAQPITPKATPANAQPSVASPARPFAVATAPSPVAPPPKPTVFASVAVPPAPPTGTAQRQPPVAVATAPAAPPRPPMAPAAMPAPAAPKAQPRRRSSGSGLLLLLLLVGLAIGGIALAQRNSQTGGSGGSPSAPDVSGQYAGTAHNNRGVNAPMTLSLSQDGTSLSGAFSVSSPLGGSGPLQGQVDASGGVSFEVTSSDGSGVVIDFTGTLSGNELTGSYTVNNGQSGAWDVTR